MKKLLFVILLVFLAPPLAWAQRVNQLPGVGDEGAAGALNDHIAAVVNDNVITTNDITQRIRLALISSGLPDTPEVEQHIFPQILRSLIDEQLQTQEAKRLEITVPKDEIDKAVDHIAETAGLPTDTRTFVVSRGGSIPALEQQIRAGLAWSKVVQRELRPRVDIGDEEVESVIERLRTNAGKEEFLVSEIYLAIDTPKDDEAVRQAAENLVQELKGGANFANVARQFSQSTGAGSGGDIGWIQEGQLPTELNHALVTMQVGQISDPIHSASGYHILILRDKRTITLGGNGGPVTLDLQQAFRPIGPHDNVASVQQEAQSVRNTINSCDHLSDQMAQKFPNWHWQNMGTVDLDKIPSWLTEKVRDTPPGKGSEPLSTDKGALIVFVCGRHVPEGKVDRDAIVNQIGTEKLELQARRLMRDLHRDAYIDLRIGKDG